MVRVMLKLTGRGYVGDHPLWRFQSQHRSCQPPETAIYLSRVLQICRANLCMLKDYADEREASESRVSLISHHEDHSGKEVPVAVVGKGAASLVKLCANKRRHP